MMDLTTELGIHDRDAEIERLRGEIESWKALVSKLESEKYREGYDNALAEQPFDRAAVIEECARVAENCVHPLMDVTVAERYRYVAAAIRALKDKP